MDTFQSQAATEVDLTIHLFGQLEIRDSQGHSAVFRRNKTGLLLAYLVLHPQQSHSRETIADLLWEEGESDTLRNRLRQELSQLRRILRVQNIDDALLIEATQNALRICSGVGSNLQQYRHTLKHAERSTDTETKTRFLLQAAALYRAPLLADFDEPQIVTERETLAHRHASAMTELAALQQKSGNLTAAVETMQTLLVRDPYREEVHADLMRLYAALGQPTQVLKQFQLLEMALKDAFDEQPSRATRQLVQELREQASSNASSTLSTSPPVQEQTGEAKQELPTPPISETAQGADAVVSPSPGLPIVAHYPPVFPYPRPIPLIVRAVKKPVIALLTLLGIVGGFFICKGVPQHNRLQLAWATEYYPLPGETETGEYTAVTTDKEGNVYACGLTQTENDTEDADIIVAKVSSDGKTLISNRFTSTGHDCDRAYSITLERGSVFVAGETYLPDRPGVKGGWQLITIKYNATTLAQEWFKFFPITAANDGHRNSYCPGWAWWSLYGRGKNRSGWDISHAPSAL